MGTTVKGNGRTVVISSDDRALEERLARYAVEITAGNPRSTSGSWKISDFLQRCSRHPSQMGLLKALVENGRMTRDEMVPAAEKKSGRELAGCRGSMSKNARACELPEEWWKDSWDPRKKKFVTELKDDVRDALKTALGEL